MSETASGVTAPWGVRIREYLAGMGPAWIAGAIAAGPASMASLITAGARFDYALLWVV
ncbi:divalent metal cation transporter, partial [Halorubrum pallidum]